MVRSGPVSARRQAGALARCPFSSKGRCDSAPTGMISFMSIDLSRVAELQRTAIGILLLVAVSLWTYRFVAWALNRIPITRNFMTSWNVRVAEKDFCDTAASLRKLGLADMPTGPLRGARRKDAAFVHARYQIFMFLIGLGCADLLAAAIDSVDQQRIQGSMETPALVLAGVVLPLLVWRARRSPGVARYRFLLSIMSAIEACEAVSSSRPDDRPKALRRLDDSCSTVRRSLLKAHLIAGSTGRRSPRRRQAKRHAALLVAKKSSHLASLR